MNIQNLTTSLQFIAAALAVPAGAAGLYSAYHNYFSPEVMCQELRNSTLVTLEKNIPTEAKCTLLRTEAAQFESRCGEFEPETNTEKSIIVTLWAEKRDAERYEREVYPRVEGIVKPYLTTPVIFKHYNVETTLCKHFVEALKDPTGAARLLRFLFLAVAQWATAFWRLPPLLFRTLSFVI